MIEIVFSDSACGSLKAAQHYGEGKFHGGVSIFFTHTDGSEPTKEEIEAARRKAEENERLSWENANPMGGNSADIYEFDLTLSIGDISEECPDSRRMQTLEHLYSFYPNGAGNRAAQRALIKASENYKAVRERAKAGECLRIWYSSQPDEMCGLYWFMEQLNRLEVPRSQISIVKLPEWEADEKGNIVQRTSWGEMPPEGWYRHLPLQRPVPAAFSQSCASHWHELQEENAPLRAVLNERLVSVSEKLYDDLILCEIAAADEKFQEAMIIGRVLGKHRPRIGDAWIALRIEEMVHTGMLEVISAAGENMPGYHRVLKKCARIA